MTLPSPLDLTHDPEVLAAYRAEAEERLLEIENGLKSLSENLGRPDVELAHGLFRCAHSIKAGANLLELRELERQAHALEDVLDGLRKGAVELNEATMDRLYEALDAMGFSLDRLRETS